MPTAPPSSADADPSSSARSAHAPLPVTPRFDALTTPQTILAWATARFPRLTLASALGPQTLAILEMLHQMDRRVPVFFLDTELLFPETYALRIRVQRRYQTIIEPVRPQVSLLEQADACGDRLWERDADLCCNLRKVRPLQRVLSGRDAWLTGLRRDSAATRAHIQPVAWDAAHGLIKINPLFAWTRPQVMRFLRGHNVPYNELLDRGYRSVGCRPCTRPTPEGGDERAGRWAGQQKTECGIHHLLQTDNGEHA